jgi:hypothetical protein
LAILIRPIVSLLTTLLIAAPFTVHAQTAAGTLVYSYVDGEVMLLLADHAIGQDRERGWGGFGGTIKDNESPFIAAARETEEESRGYFPRAMVERKIRDQEPVIDGEFALYFLEISNIDPALIYRQPIGGLPESYHERGPYMWIPFASVSRHLEQYGTAVGIEIEPGHLPDAAVSSWYWDIWLENIVAATLVDALPWIQDQD